MGAIHFLFNIKPKGVPRGAWILIRSPNWPAYTGCISIVIFLGTVLPSCMRTWQRLGGTRISPFAGLLPMFAIGIAAPLVFGHRARRFKKHVKERDYQLCINCGYDLVGLPQEYRCPECGGQYNMPEVKEAWQKWLSI